MCTPSVGCSATVGGVSLRIVAIGVSPAIVNAAVFSGCALMVGVAGYGIYKACSSHDSPKSVWPVPAARRAAPRAK